MAKSRRTKESLAKSLTPKKEKVKVIEITEIDSSQIDSLHYNIKDKNLTCTFKKGGIYLYSNVSREELDTILEAESIGSEFNKTIVKGNKPYVKLK